MTRILDIGLPVVALALLAVGGYWGLVLAPPEESMGDVYRIMFVHVPAAWVALLAYAVTFVASIVYMFKSSTAADAVAKASCEIGVVFNLLLLISGSIWGRPTWGVWWSWDPRLTWAAIMFFTYAGYLTLRSFVEEPEKRATWAAVAGIMMFVNVIIVWFSVKWWATLHQVQSTPRTLGTEMFTALMVNGVAYLCLYGWFLRLRYGIARARQEFEIGEPPPLESNPRATSAPGAAP